MPRDTFSLQDPILKSFIGIKIHPIGPLQIMEKEAHSVINHGII